MVAWNIWKASFRQGSPDPLEPSTTQREASSIYWLFLDKTLPVQQSILIACMCSSDEHFKAIISIVSRHAYEISAI